MIGTTYMWAMHRYDSSRSVTCSSLSAPTQLVVR